MPSDTPLTNLIQLAADGFDDAKEQLYLAVYRELREAAHRIVRKQRGVGDLQTTALVNEVVLRFEKGAAFQSISSRRAFFAVAIRAMHQILIDHYRSCAKLVDSPDRVRSPLDAALNWIVEEAGCSFAELQLELEKLAEHSPRQHAVVTHRFFGGLTIQQTAELLQVSPQTVERDWRLARAKLRRGLTRPH